MDEAQRKIVDDTLRNAVTDALGEFPDESVERQVRAAALRIAVSCAEDQAECEYQAGSPQPMFKRSGDSPSSAHAEPL